MFAVEVRCCRNGVGLFDDQSYLSLQELPKQLFYTALPLTVGCRVT